MMTEQSKKSKGIPVRGGRQYSAVEAKKNVDSMRKKFNDELLQILEEEQANENKREEQLQNAKTQTEANELEKKFGLERARASQRILDVSEQHQKLLMMEMK